MNEWEKFKVGVPAVTKGFNSDCIPFNFVSHTSHIGPAISIIEAGEIRPSLVFDESILNDQRILVSWLSPNHWSHGYRYGNVQFNFSFNKLIQGKQYYWVESIAYKVKACRILITDIDRVSQLDPYDPTLKSGPWWFDEAGKQHYFNNTHCLEFMIEAPIKLDCLSKLDFVDHHPSFCSIHRNNPNKCPEIGLNSSLGGALFLTRAIVTGIDLSFLLDNFITKNLNPTSALLFAFEDFCIKNSSRVQFTGTINQYSESSKAIVRGIMSAFTFGATNEAKILCAMFQDKHNFINVAAMVFAEAVGLQDWEKLADT